MRNRLSAAVLFVSGLFLAGCGYPGEPLPPALRRPVPVTDLAVLQRGANIHIRFTVPTRTTENLPLEDPDLEVRIGAMPDGGWNPDVWAQNSTRIPQERLKITAHVANLEIPSTPYEGRAQIVGVRAHGPKGTTTGWSNFETLGVVSPLPTPQGLEARDASDAVRLDWHATTTDFRVFRREVGTAEWSLIASVQKPTYLDPEITYGREYEYFVQAVEKTGDRYAESELSTFLKFKPVDRFPPVAPSGLVAVVGTRTVELVWDRNAEGDFASYRVYRDGKMVSESGSAPAFSDHAVVPGTKYSYLVTALDTAGNESARSAAVEALVR